MPVNDSNFSPEDLNVILELVNNVDVDSALNFINSDEFLVEQAWLTAAQESMERQWVVTVMTCYAQAKGLLTGFSLTLPEVFE